MAELTNKQKKFCDEYLIDLNATRAYKAVYPDCKKEETINAAASRMLRNVKIKKYIDKRIRDREKRTEITQDKVLNELAKIAFSNGTDFASIVQKPYIKPIYDEKGKKIGEEKAFYKDVEVMETKDIPEEKRKAIAAIKQTKYGISIESCDKVKALELLGRHLGMFNDKLNVNADVNSTVTANIDLSDFSTEELKSMLKGDK